MLAAERLRSAEDAKAAAERQGRQLQDELATQKATEKRLRDRLARREDISTERKEVRLHHFPMSVCASDVARG